MIDGRTLASIAGLGLVSYLLRSSGFLAAGLMREDGTVAKFLRLAPGNLFVAFVVAACLDGGWSSAAGCLVALAIMAATGKEWAALAAGFATAAISASLHLL